MTTVPEAIASNQTSALPEEPHAKQVVQKFGCDHCTEYSHEGSSCN
ncbi:hypothetical protein ABDK96_11790 [Citricoccus nitrophenolicus]|uniref:Uncharacterized protein n=1 Tax=Citricoccus nitrophenolicus TaxID=863575 RepID=A0ABV0IL67_9MICC|nr:hypothetical protein [Citricoccus sp. I39-566]WMY79684.1 hypothetical protein RE421_07515 [Citricoccus sp. I39-566]